MSAVSYNGRFTSLAAAQLQSQPAAPGVTSTQPFQLPDVPLPNLKVTAIATTTLIERHFMITARPKRSNAVHAPATGRWHLYAIAPGPSRSELSTLASALPEAAWQEFPSGQDFLSAVPNLPQGCALVFDPLGDIETLALVGWLGQQRPDIGSIVVSANPAANHAVRCLKAGAGDFIHRPLDRDAAVAAVTAMFEPAPERPTRSMVLRRLSISNRLSFREMEVLEALISGLSNKEVGTKLKISERTVEVHRSRIMRRLEVESFAQLVRMSVQAGLGPV